MEHLCNAPGDYSVSESVEEEEKAKEKEKEQAPVVNLDDLAKKLEMEKKRQEEGLELVVNPERRGKLSCHNPSTTSRGRKRELLEEKEITLC